MKKYLGTAYKGIKKQKDIQALKPALADDFIEYFEKHLDLPEEVAEEARRICKRLKDNPAFAGRSQIGLAAGSVNLASEKYSCKEIGDKSRSKRETVRKNSERITENIDIGF